MAEDNFQQNWNDYINTVTNECQQKIDSYVKTDEGQKELLSLQQSIKTCKTNNDILKEHKDLFQKLSIQMEKAMSKFVKVNKKIEDCIKGMGFDSLGEFDVFVKNIPQNALDEDVENIIRNYIKNKNNFAKQHISLTNTLIRKDPNDKLTKKFFNPLPAQTEEQKMELNLGEIKKGKNKGYMVYQNVNWEFTPEFLAMNPQLEEFKPFNRVVVNTLNSEFVTHNKSDKKNPVDITLDALYRAMTGDDGTDKRKIVTPKMKAEILKSIDKGMGCVVTIDLTEACKEFGYNGGEPVIIKAPVLNCKYIDGVVVNGKPTTIIRMFDTTPFYQSAEVLNGQILTYEKKLLALPKNKTVDSIVIGDYLLRRLLEIIEHKMTLTIVLDTVFEETDFSDITPKKREKLLAHIEAYFDYWLELGKIKSYFFVDKKGQQIKGAKWRTIERDATDGTTHKVSEIYRPKARGTKLGFYAVKFTY